MVKKWPKGLLQRIDCFLEVCRMEVIYIERLKKNMVPKARLERRLIKSIN